MNVWWMIVIALVLVVFIIWFLFVRSKGPRV